MAKHGLCNGYGDQEAHVAEIYAKGKCWPCYRAAWRAARPPEKKKHVWCVECGKWKPHRARGMCAACYQSWWRDQQKAKEASPCPNFNKQV